MNIIDRYVKAVMNRIPLVNRDDVEKKLRTRIDGLLPKNASESDIQTVLEQLGNPVVLADEYHLTKRYLIGPDVYDRYLSVLKVVMLVVPIIAAMIALLQGIIEVPVDSGLFDYLIETFSNMVGSAIEGAAQAFVWVTLTFVIIERKGISKDVFPIMQKKWSIEELEEKTVPKKSRITRSEMVFAMFFTVFFAAVIYFKPELIGWYSLQDGDLNLTEPLFVLDRLSDYIPAIIILALVQLAVHISKFIKKRWTFPIAITNFGYNLGISVLYSIMAGDKSLFNKGFISEITELTHLSISQTQWFRFTWVVAAFIVVGCTIDSIVGLVKCKK